MKLHDDEVDTDAALVEALLADQFPELAGLPVRAFRSTGTVNAIYRLGDEFYARLPRVEQHVRGPPPRARVAPAPRSVAVPARAGAGRVRPPRPRISVRVGDLPLARGRAVRGRGEREHRGRGRSGPWPRGRGGAARGLAAGGGVARGHAASAAAGERGAVDDERDAAVALARFVAELRTVPVTAAAPRGGRRPLRELDRITRDALATIGDAAALAAWERALEAPPFRGAPVWIHGDLLRPNLLAAGGRLSAVIDFGSAGVGDPAADVVAAWAVFRAPGRTRFREALGVDDGTWERARGYALHQAALIVPYYADTNPGFVAHARRTIAQVLAD